MPGLFDMWGGGGGGFTPLVAPGSEQPRTWNDVIQQRQNSLVGMGLGLMGGGWQGGMKGFETGADIDARRAQAAATLQQHALDRAQRASQFGQELALRQKEFDSPAQVRLWNATANDPQMREALFPKTQAAPYHGTI